MVQHKDDVFFHILDWIKVDQDQFDEFRFDYDDNNYPLLTTADISAHNQDHDVNDYADDDYSALVLSQDDLSNHKPDNEWIGSDE